MNAPIQSTIDPTISASKPRLAFIDGMRALAALYVVISHAFLEQNNGQFHNHHLMGFPAWSAHFAVGVFIVLSGYCLMLPIARKGDHIGSLREFFHRRALRILPPYYITLFLSILFIATIAGEKTGSIWDINLPLKMDTVLTHFLLIHDAPVRIQGGMINYPLWSIAVEFQIYLLMPLITISLRRLGNVRTLLWTMSLGLLHFGLHGRIDSMVPWYVGLFTMGAIGARWCMQCPSKVDPRLAWVAWGLVVLTVLVALKKGDLFMVSHFYIFDTIIGAATAVLLCTSFIDASKKVHIFTRLLSWKPLEDIGIFSYSLYLIHAPLLHWVNMLLSRFLHPSVENMLFLLLCSIPLIIGIAKIFHLAFEKPFMSSFARKCTTSFRP
jgi:peptidoglycan/LPS O-acetylase OafA/YrhL